MTGKKYLFIIVLLVIITHAYGQQKAVDTLLVQLKHSKNDTSRLVILSHLSSAYTAVDPVLSYKYAVELKNLAEKTGKLRKKADAYLLMGLSWGIRSRYDSAIIYYNTSLQQAQKINYETGVGDAYINLGVMFQQVNDDVKAASFYLKAIPLFERSKYLYGLNTCYDNLGSIYAGQKSYSLALTFYHHSLIKYQQSNDLHGESITLNSIGSCLFSMGKFDEALTNYRKSLKLNNQAGNLTGAAANNSGIGELYTKLKKFDTALLYLQRALGYLTKINDEQNMLNVYELIAENYLLQNKTMQAQTYALQSLTLAKKLNSNLGIAQALKTLATAQKQNGNAIKAYDYLKEYIKYRDLIFDEEKLKQISLVSLERMQIDNSTLFKENQLKSAEISKNKLRIELYNLIIILGTIIFILIVLQAIVLYRSNKNKNRTNQLLNSQKEEILAYNAQLATLNENITASMEVTMLQNIELERVSAVKSKLYAIISHDFRGPLSTLKSLLDLSQTENFTNEELKTHLKGISVMADNTLIFLENLLVWTKSQMDGISVDPESFNMEELVLENIKLLEGQAALKGVEIVNTIAQPILVFADRDMIKLVIRNLLANAIKFTWNGGTITLFAEIDNKMLKIGIKDTGVGISEKVKAGLFKSSEHTSVGTAMEKGSGLGLIMCYDFVKCNKGTIAAESELNLGSTFYFTVPLAD